MVYYQDLVWIRDSFAGEHYILRHTFEGAKRKNRRNEGNDQKGGGSLLGWDQASDGRCQNGTKFIEENTTGIHVDTTRTEATSSNGVGFVPTGSDVDVSRHPVHGICFAVCSKDISEHAA